MKKIVELTRHLTDRTDFLIIMSSGLLYMAFADYINRVTVLSVTLNWQFHSSQGRQRVILFVCMGMNKYQAENFK